MIVHVLHLGWVELEPRIRYYARGQYSDVSR
jgi:hypothetical protein